MQKQFTKIIALLGGSFDPPTIAHYIIAAECLNQQLSDEVWLIPCGKRLDKKNVTDPEVRLKMVDMMLQELNPKQYKLPIYSNDIEVKNGTTIVTYELLKQLNKQYSEYKFLFIIGSDLLSTLESWDNGKELKQENDFIVYERVGYPIQQEYLPDNSKIINEVKFDVSSTLIRQRIQNKQDKLSLGVQSLVTNDIIQFIQQNKLYT